MANAKEDLQSIRHVATNVMRLIGQRPEITNYLERFQNDLETKFKVYLNIKYRILLVAAKFILKFQNTCTIGLCRPEPTLNIPRHFFPEEYATGGHKLNPNRTEPPTNYEGCFKGKAPQNQNLRCLVCYLKIINSCLKEIMTVSILMQIV